MNMKYLKKYKCAKLILKPNYILIPVTTFNMDPTGVEEFNKIYRDVRKLKGFHQIVRTKSNGISYSTKLPAYDIRHTTTCVEITLLCEYGMFRFQCRNANSTTNVGNIKGHQAFIEFKKMLKDESGIDINEYAIDDGIEVKKTIEKPLIQMEKDSFKDKIINNVHHVDFHNSYPAGLVNTHPEFGPIITKLYEMRKTNEVYKAVLNLTVGYFQSVSCCKAKWAHLTRDAIKNNNDRVRELAARLKKSGRVVLAYNTDGIWYTGKVYHGSGEGDHLGEWHNDHINCTARFKSAGAYEYIEDGKYNVVLRGRCNLDNIKPREQWQWGDIYNNDAVVYKYVLTENGLEETYE